jgi:hypothetical protein
VVLCKITISESKEILHFFFRPLNQKTRWITCFVQDSNAFSGFYISCRLPGSVVVLESMSNSVFLSSYLAQFLLSVLYHFGSQIYERVHQDLSATAIDRQKAG